MTKEEFKILNDKNLQNIINSTANSVKLNDTKNLNLNELEELFKPLKSYISKTYD